MATPTPTYGALLRVPGIPALIVGSLFARTAVAMLRLTLVLFVLSEYHSPALAGLASFCWVLPSLIVAPIAGALVDRYGRIRLIVFDYSIQFAAFMLIGALSLAGKLPPAVLLTIVALASPTAILSLIGGRTLYPMLVPASLWERANAIDSQSYVVSMLIGPSLAGVLVGALGGPWAIIACALAVAAAAVAMSMAPEPASERSPGALLANALGGVRYVLGCASLRGLAITNTIFNFGYGIFTIALPVLILDRLHQPPVIVGLSYALTGVVGGGAGLLVGRIRTEGRERQMMAVADALMLIAFILFAAANSLPMVFIASAIFGLAAGAFDVAMLTLRQRRTDRAWYGRAFAVSISLNRVGMPIGSALAGPLIAWSLFGTLWAVAAVTAATAVLPLLAIPAHQPPRPPT